MSSGEILVGLSTMIALGLFGLFLRRTFAGIDGLFQAVGQRFNGVDARLDRYENRIERTERDAVAKEDWLRELHIGRKRQERMLADLAELKGQNNGAMEIGTAIRRLAERDGRS